MTNEQGKHKSAGDHANAGEGEGLMQNNSNLMWIGVGVGAAIGIAVALSRRKKEPWYSPKQVSKRVADHTSDLASASKDIVDRLKIIYNESCKVVEEASDLWAQGRKLAGV